VFDAGGGTTQREDRHAKRFSAVDLEAARAEGLAAGLADAQAAADQAMAQQIKASSAAMVELYRALEAETVALRREAVTVAVAAARKVAGRALEDFGEARAIEVFDTAMETIGDQPRLVVRLPAASLERVRPALTEAAEAHGFSGALVLRPLPGSVPGDVVIEWADGAMAVSQAEVFARIDELLAQGDWAAPVSRSKEP
jgi:flagellar assembly protein FliH